MIFWTTITNMMKYKYEKELPQVVGPQSGAELPTSYKTNGQFSPVEITKIKMKLEWKFLKFLYSGSSC